MTRLVARIIEFLMILSSLFWAVEANASQGRKVLEPSLDRRPAAAYVNHVRSPSSEPSLLPNHELKTTHRPGYLLPEIAQFKAVDSVIFGESLSWTYQQNPYFVPTSFQLIRFPTP